MLCKITHCAGRVPARPHQLYQGGRDRDCYLMHKMQSSGWLYPKGQQKLFEGIFSSCSCLSCSCLSYMTEVIYMWQSRVEIEGYSVVYFVCIAAFKAPYHWTSIKGGAHTRFVDSLAIHASTKRVWAPPLMEVQRYGTLNAAMRSKYATE